MSLQKNIKYLFFLLLFVLFWQTRLNPVGPRLVDYQVPFIYLTDLLVLGLILAGAFLYKRGVLARPGTKQVRKLFALAVVFLLLAALSNLNAWGRPILWYRFAKLVLFFAFSFWLGWILPRLQISVGQVADLISWGLGLEGLIALGEFLKGGSWGLQLLGEWRFSLVSPGIATVQLGAGHFLRPYATFPHPNVLGGIFAIAANWQFFRAWQTQKPSAWAAFLFFVLITLLSFSRSAWLSFIVGFLFVLNLASRDRSFYKRLGGYFQAAKDFTLAKRVGLSLALVSAAVLTGLLLWVVGDRFSTLASEDLATALRRIQLNRAALRMFLDHPLLGVGLGNFVFNLETYQLVFGQGRFLQPVHNVWLLVLAEQGILGFLAWLAFLVGLLGWFLRGRPLDSSDSSWLIFLGWLGILVTSFLDHYWWTLQAGQLFLFLTIGLTMATMEKERPAS